jgi:putative transposase
MIRYWCAHYEVSERRACALAMCSRSLYRYESRRDPRTELRARIREIAQVRVRYGYRRVHVLLGREGWKANHKLVYRLYREEGLSLRRKRPKRHVSAVHREARAVPAAPNEAWSMDFVADQLVHGARFRALTVVDVFTKECLAIEVGQSLKGEHVVTVLKRIVGQRGAPKVIFCDNGSEFVGRALDLWAYVNKVRIDFSRPGKPTDNAHVESFNGRLREECLNSHWFVSMQDAKRAIEAWRTDYNENRPHRALENRTPLEFAIAARNYPCSNGEKTPETLNQTGTKSG